MKDDDLKNALKEYDEMVLSGTRMSASQKQLSYQSFIAGAVSAKQIFFEAGSITKEEALEFDKQVLRGAIEDCNISPEILLEEMEKSHE